nr:hypothetical protein [uncultured Mediterranean phage uvMED]
MSKTIAQDCIISGGQLIVGGDKIPLPLVGFSGATLPPGGPIPGAAYISGPLMVGQRAPFVNPASQGTVMITRVNPAVAAAYIPPRPMISIQNTPGVPALPTDILIGTGAPCGITINTGMDGGLLNIIYGTNVKTHNVAGEFSINLLKDDLASFAKKIAAKLEAGFETRLSAIASLAAKIESGPTFNSSFSQSPCGKFPIMDGYATRNKPFDIPHPKKDKKRIRHICAEGPESGIYVRGRLTDKNVIELPEYWDGLIDPDSITVNLTQIGYSQDLIVESIDWGKVVRIKSGTGANINCFYEVWAARWIDSNNHNEKLHVVYDGESPANYPGDNNNFSFSLPPGYNNLEK